MTVQGEGVRSAWLSVWLSPRETIESIVSTQPGRFVWLLAALGGIASLNIQTLGTGFLDALAGWRLWLGFLVVGAVAGILFLYVNAVILRAVGGWMGGPASAVELRAVLAWSWLPAIVGLVIALALKALSAGVAGISPAVLSLLSTAVAGLSALWSFVVMLLMLARVERFGFWRTIVTYGVVVLFAALIALVIRTFLFQPFNMPSRSMYPTLVAGDNFFVSKFGYGYTRYSFPFSSPWFAGRIFGSEPARGDVVVFMLPKDDKTAFVKRVVGLPGDRIQMQRGALYINGEAVKRERMEDFTGDDPCGTDPVAKVKRWRETLPSGAIYETFDCVDNGFYDNTDVYEVPPGHFFMLGDNRDNSTDSRVLSAVGYIPLDHIIGRVEMVYFSKGPDHDGGPPRVRSERVGLMIH